MANMKNFAKRMHTVFNSFDCAVCHKYIPVEDRFHVDHPYVILCAEGRKLLGVGVHQKCIEVALCPVCREPLEAIGTPRQWEDLVYVSADQSIIHSECRGAHPKMGKKTKW
jgi:uncharacterized protein YbaR (Trm112 family)